MGYVIGRQTCYRTESGKELDECIYNNEYARTYRNRDEENVHRYIGIEPSESEQDAEHRTGSTDGVEHRGVVHEAGCIIGAGHVIEHHHPNEFLNQRRSETADEVIEREAFGTPLLLDHRGKHPDRKHIKEYMAEVRMQEHIGERLPPMERTCGDIMQSANGI